MEVSPPIATLQHGTTRRRAENIVRNGPDGHFLEPGELRRADIDFSAVLATLPKVRLKLGDPEEIALRKVFPGEGGAVILEMDVPARIVDLVCNDYYGNLHALSGAICFSDRCGLSELQVAWSTIPIRILPV